MVGCGSKHIYRAYNNTVDALERAIKERMLFYKEEGEYWPMIRPNPDAFSNRAAKFKSAIKKLSVWTLPTEMVPFAESFSGQKRLRYLKAAENLSRQGFRKEWTKVKMFLKFETYNLSLKPDAKPRGIYPRSDEFLVDYGRRIKAIEKKIYNALEEMFGYDVIFKGKNQRSRGGLLEKYWNEMEDPVAISADASAFEASVSDEALAFCHEIYNYYIRGDKHFQFLQRSTIVNRIFATAPDGTIEVVVLGRKMSGDPDTALGNCLVSAFMMHTLFGDLQIEKHRACIDGDDVVFIIERKELHKVLEHGKKFYRDFGFRMVFEKPVYEIEHLTFCQSQPVWTPDGYIMVRNPYHATAKDAFSRKDLSSKTNYLRWISSVGMCGLSTNGGIPIMQEYYQQYVRNGKGAPIFENDDLFQEFRTYKVQGMKRRYEDIHPRTRYSFHIAFNIAPDEQVIIEDYYAALELDHNVTEADVMPTPDLPW
jgi:hypothetical protein